MVNIRTERKSKLRSSPRCATAAAVPAKFGATYSGAKGMGTVLPQPIFSSLSCRIAPFSSSFAACACARDCADTNVSHWERQPLHPWQDSQSDGFPQWCCSHPV